ncbi:MAG: DNA polymerase III subunit gamma/tau, partial [Chloroflexota bacterium]|nr:DNA polymerase III subunit gamma/tau [Chloroflexota bacterium]
MAQALYRKWRSQTFDEVVGQEHVMQTLRNALRDERVAHAYLFAGPRGTGKTSTARILAKAINCTAPEDQRPCDKCPTCIAISEGRMLDLIEIDAASNNSVDDIRELRDKVGFRPSEGRYKLYIIDEVHMLSNSAFNALLKTLEEPPPHARFILATTEPHKIPATVLSRCQRFDFRRIPVPEIAAHLLHIVGVEGFTAEAEALTAIARSAQGCMRDAISLLDQMLSYGAETITFAQVQQAMGAVSAQSVSALVDALAMKQAAVGLALIQQLVTEGASLTEFCHQVIEHLRGVMVIQMTGDASLLVDLPADTVQQMQRQAKAISAVTTFAAIKRFSVTIQELKGGYHPQLPLELALIETMQAEAMIAAPAMNGLGLPMAVQTAPSPAIASTPPPTVAQPIITKPEITPPLVETLASSPAANEPPPLDGVAIQKLKAHWKEFMNQARTACGVQVQAALKAVRDIAVGEQTVALAFGSNEFSRAMVARPDT